MIEIDLNQIADYAIYACIMAPMLGASAYISIKSLNELFQNKKIKESSLEISLLYPHD